MDYGLRTVAALHQEGWSSRQVQQAIKDGHLVRVRRGVVSTATTLEALDVHRRAIAAAVMVTRTPSVVSHTSAALLHGLPVRNLALEFIHLTRCSRGSGRIAGNIHLHEAPVTPADTCTIGGVPVTSLERTVLDVARQERFEWGVIAADAALRLGADPARWVEPIRLGERVRGNGRCREVIAFADRDAESAAESMSRVMMMRAGLPRPVLQFEVRDAFGQWIARGDFGWPDFKVIGEMDGKSKFVDDPRRGRTAGDKALATLDRDRLIRDCGWVPCHWGWDTATSPTKLAALLGRHLGR